MIRTITLNPALDRSITLEQLKAGELNLTTQAVIRPAGKGINVSRFIHWLGGQSLAYTLAGGQAGTLLEEGCKQEHIYLHNTHIEGNTRENIKIKDQSTGLITEINEQGPRIKPEEWQLFFTSFINDLKENDIAVFSGSLPPGIQTEDFKELISAAVAKKAKVLVDTRDQALHRALEANPWFIKPNLEEFLQLTNESLTGITQLTQGCMNLLGRHPQINIWLSLGSRGSLFVNAQHQEYLPPLIPLGKAKNTVGAGDSLMAAFAFGMEHQLNTPQILQLGNHLAARIVAGSEPEKCHFNALREFL